MVTLKDLAKQLGMDRSHLRKFVKFEMGIEPERVRDPASGNQLALAITEEESARVEQERQARGYSIGKTRNGMRKTAAIGGEFYLVQLEPTALPKRVKLGYTTNIAARLTSHRVPNPNAVIVKSWPCRSSWEDAAICALSNLPGCVKISKEVFDSSDIPSMVKRGDEFFQLLPR
jgi:hypothetical protein